MKIKTTLLVSACSLAFFVAGCTAAPGPQGPQGQQGATGDPGRDADQRRADEQKRLDDQKRADEQARTDQDAGCPAGEHRAADRDGKTSCVRD
ncbi:MAG: hypothetical protein WBE13_20195 [Candidatus Acidiferrum sp.]